MDKVAAIIQARYGATRLPGKVLLKVLDKTILEYVIERVKKARTIKQVIIATTIKRNDRKIVNLLDKVGISVYRGSENDVLDRFYQAAQLFKIKHIVRITADCPLIDPKIIDKIVDRYFKSKTDYCANTLEETFPDGEDVEVFSFSALSLAWKNARLLSEREHVTPYIRNHPEMFKILNVRNRTNLHEKRWTLDRGEDFKFIKSVLENLYPVNPDFSMQDVLKYLKDNASIEKINRDIIRNEGYLKSLKEDKVVSLGKF